MTAKMLGVKELKAVGITHPGKVRDNNEDSYMIYEQESMSLYAVADGMGGHAAGEVASKLALETIYNYLTTNGGRLEETVAMGESLRPHLFEMLKGANRSVLQASDDKQECNGMGTTLTLLFVIAGQYWIGHIGDSRAYLIRDAKLITVTEDHTLVTQLARSGQISEEEKDNHPQRHILTQALGTDATPDFDLRQCPLQHDDRVLLTTDGLYSMVENDELLAAVVSDEPADTILAKLVELANTRGGNDNITAILITVS